MAPLAGLQAGQTKRADGDAHQAQGRMAGGRGHVADLPLLALVQHDPQPRGRDGGPVADGDAARRQIRFHGQQLDPGRGQQLTLHGHARPQRGQGFGRGDVFHLDEIDLGQLVARVGQPVGQVAVVGEQQQPLAVVIQPAGRVDAGHGHVVGQGGPAFGVGEGGEHSVGFEEQHVAHDGILA